MGGNISYAGSPSYYEKGVCYSTYQNPTTGNNKTPALGSETGNFTTYVSGLSQYTTYYVRAYAISSQGTAYGNQISFTTTQQQTATTYYFDDGTAEHGWRINPNNEASLGNGFGTDDIGFITSIDIYGYYSSDNTNRQVRVNIYNSSKQLSGSSSLFTLSTGWQNISLPNIPFNYDFYVMVEWPNTSGYSHYVGIDLNGPFGGYSNISYYYSSSYGWATLYEATGKEGALGPFLIRANANIAGKKKSYGPPNLDETKIYNKPSVNEVENIRKTLNSAKK